MTLCLHPGRCWLGLAAVVGGASESDRVGVGKSYAVAVELKGASEEILLVSLSARTSAIFQCDAMRCDAAF